MILYKTPAGVWTGTQADARAAAKAESGDPKNWVEFNVPVDKAGLLWFLNEHRVAASNAVAIDAPVPTPEEDDPWGIAEELPEVTITDAPEFTGKLTIARANLDRTTFAPMTKTVDDVVGAIHEADHADLSNYFEAVIYRAKELQP